MHPVLTTLLADIEPAVRRERRAAVRDRFEAANAELGDLLRNVAAAVANTRLAEQERTRAKK